MVGGAARGCLRQYLRPWRSSRSPLATGVGREPSVVDPPAGVATFAHVVDRWGGRAGKVSACRDRGSRNWLVTLRTGRLRDLAGGGGGGPDRLKTRRCRWGPGLRRDVSDEPDRRRKASRRDRPCRVTTLRLSRLEATSLEQVTEAVGAQAESAVPPPLQGGAVQRLRCRRARGADRSARRPGRGLGESGTSNPGVFALALQRPELPQFAREAARKSPETVQRIAVELEPLRLRAPARLEEGMCCGAFRQQDPGLLLFTLYTAVVVR